MVGDNDVHCKICVAITVIIYGNNSYNNNNNNTVITSETVSMDEFTWQRIEYKELTGITHTCKQKGTIFQDATYMI